MARKRVSVMMGAVVAATTTAFAATYTWTDGAGDHLFSTPGNWDGGAAPTAATAADTLAFTTGGFATNDIAGLTVGDIAVTLAAGDELTLGGAQKIGGSGTLTLGGDGTGTLVFDVTGGLDEQPIVINAGIFKVGESLTGSALGSAADTVPIRVNAGGTLDVNYTSSTIVYERCQVTHDKLIYIAGTGAAGAGGAIINSNTSPSQWPPQLGDVVLTADATIGPKRTDFGTLVNGSTEYGARAAHASITGDYVLTFTDTAPGRAVYHGIRRGTVNVKSITITNGAELLVGQDTTFTLSDNIIRLVAGGKICCSGQSSSLPIPCPVTVEGSDNRIRCTNGTGYFNGPLTIADGAALTFSEGTLHLNGKVTGDPTVSRADTSYCNAYFKGGVDGIVTFKGSSGNASGRPIFDTANSSFYGAFLTTGEATIDGRTGELVRKSGNLFTGNPLNAAGGITVNGQENFGAYGTETTDIVLITNSTISVSGNFTAGRLSPRSAGNKVTMRLGEGTTVTAGNVYTGNNAWPNHGAIEILSGAVVNVTNSICVGFHDGNAVPAKGPTNEWLTVDGGTLNASDSVIGCGFQGPQSRIYLKSGTINAQGVCMQGYKTAKKNSGFTSGKIRFGGTNTYQFVMTGGTLNLGMYGFRQYGREENSEANVILSGGTLNATDDFPIPYFIPTLFGTWRDGFSDSFTLNTAGHEVELRTALNGASAVTLTGAGTIAGTNAMQGVLGGKWTVDGGMTADLRGAASFLGGLAVGANAAVTLDVGAGRSAAFFSRDGSAPLTAASASTNILARFNEVDGGTVASTISRDLWLWNVSGSSGTGIPGYAGGTGETLLSKGEFYVEEAEAGTWTFSGIYGDNVYIQIDDQSATSTSISSYAHLQVALSAGWHRFIVICVHSSGDFGPKSRPGLAIGFAKSAVSGNAAADYTPFSPRNLKMRPSAPAGGAATVRWSTYKTKAWKVPGVPNLTSSNQYNDWLWDTVSLTNSLKLLDRYGKYDERMNANVANRFDGWFLVPFDQAGTWRLQFQYDDRMRIYIDGEYIGTYGENTVHTNDWAMSAGWHRYEIRVYDSTGNSGPKDGSAINFAVKRPGESAFGAYKKFNEDNLTLALTPDGYLQGDITLASGAAVTNVSDEAAIVWGDVKVANGATGAALSGKFACVSNTVDFGTVAANTPDLSAVLKFHNAATNLFADVGKIAVDFAAKPTRGTILVGPAGGLEALSHAELARRFRVTVDGVPASEVKCIVLPRVSEGKLYLNNVSGTQLLFR